VNTGILSKRIFYKKLKLAQYTYEEGHRATYEARIVGAESKNRYRKSKESAHMAYLTNPSSQPSLDNPSHLDPHYQE
jgi:hypothetical protein